MTFKDELLKIAEGDEGMTMAIELMFEANENEEIRKLIVAREKAREKAIKEKQEKRKIAEKKLEKTTEEAIEKLIQTCKAFDDTKEQTVKKIMHAYKLTEADATSKVEQYWNDNN